MKVLLYADFRSSHARGWREGLVASGLEVVAISSEVVVDYDAESPSDRVSRRRQEFVESRAARSATDTGPRSARRKGLLRVFSGALDSQTFHSLVYLLRARYLRKRLERIVLAETPDLIHALRIPYEGVTALTAKTNVPRVVSTWGSDIVPQSTSDPILGRWMRRVLRRVDGFQFDSTQDLDRALERGLPLDIPSLHAAGNFGVEDKLFYVSDEREKGLVVYPRRAKPNANYRGFVAAAIELSNSGGARFVGVGLRAAEAELNEIFEGAEIEAVELTGQLSRAEMATLLRRAEVVVSPTFWDGTPISVLEAVACGAKVIAGTLPELLMLQEQGMDIDLIDASSTPAIVEAIERALGSERMGDASSLPQQFDRRSNQSRVTRFYREVVAERSR